MDTRTHTALLQAVSVFFVRNRSLYICTKPIKSQFVVLFYYRLLRLDS